MYCATANGNIYFKTSPHSDTSLRLHVREAFGKFDSLMEEAGSNFFYL
jgi:hypothetical protein